METKGNRKYFGTQVQQYLIEKGDYCPEQEQSFSPALCNRLDRGIPRGLSLPPKCGILADVKPENPRTPNSKYYLCMVTGVPKPEHQLLVGYWKKNQKNNLVTISPQPVPDGKKVITEYTVQKQMGNIACWRFSSIQGGLIKSRHIWHRLGILW